MQDDDFVALKTTELTGGMLLGLREGRPIFIVMCEMRPPMTTVPSGTAMKRVLRAYYYFNDVHGNRG